MKVIYGVWFDCDGGFELFLQVDYGATAEELEQHFHGCGAVNRVTILCNKYDGHPKGFAYIEFSEKDSVQMAMALDESLFRGRQLKASPKVCIVNFISLYYFIAVTIVMWNIVW